MSQGVRVAGIGEMLVETAHATTRSAFCECLSVLLRDSWMAWLRVDTTSCAYALLIEAFRKAT